MKKAFIICLCIGVISYLSLNLNKEKEIEVTITEVQYKKTETKEFQTTNIEEDEAWKLRLINAKNPVPQEYMLEVVTLSNGEQVDHRIYPFLQKMFDDARENGIYPVVTSGYRTNADQQRIYDDRIEQHLSEGYTKSEALELTKNFVANPGTSEHEMAIAVDIGGDWVNSTSAEVYDWLESHAHEYGFILRYPENKTHITGIN
ncbi:hypothetical protein AN643_03900, partial [Candidatus Epulonipiscioides saccharophilum]